MWWICHIKIVRTHKFDRTAPKSLPRQKRRFSLVSPQFGAKLTLRAECVSNAEPKAKCKGVICHYVIEGLPYHRLNLRAQYMRPSIAILVLVIWSLPFSCD